MSGHDPCCPIYDLPVADCVVCTAIGEARGEEKAIFQRVWKENIQPLTSRYYREGYQDATNGKPIAGWVT